MFKEDCMLISDLFTARSNLHPIHLFGENVEKLFSQNVLKSNGKILKCMIKEVKLFSYHQNFGGYLPLPLGYIHV